MSFDIKRLREVDPAIVALGSHPGIIQSILDFDYLVGRAKPSVVAIVATGRSLERYAYGPVEIVIPVFNSPDVLPSSLQNKVNLALDVASGRRVQADMTSALEAFPNLVGGNVFAEGVPERHAIDLQKTAEKRDAWIAGPASVGVIVPGVVKLGAIGGIEADHMQASRLFAPGSVAVVSSSGGMVNEIIRSVATSGHAVSFAVAVGGERYPMLTPSDAFLAAEEDPNTKAIAYFGELGGEDEYQLAELLQSGKVTKPVLAYIAGSVAELFASPPQFGHAKAMAASKSESARAKADALRAAGAHACATYGEFINAIAALPADATIQGEIMSEPLERPEPGLFVNAISHDEGDDVKVLGQDPVKLANDNSFAKIVISMILGRMAKSESLEQFTDLTLKMLVDHGPYVSGAVNTMVTARAGRDLVSALASGLLTIGPRFGGAINQAAVTWFAAVNDHQKAADLVESMAAKKQYISGIGHRKYRTDKPDPRVKQLLDFSLALDRHPYSDFALSVEAETSAKKANLILNVDGAIAAVLLDLLQFSEGLDEAAIQGLLDAEAFNALFVLSRSVGFMAHYFDQRRHDEGLFRLEPKHITPISKGEED
ncbi:MAG TPA: citrate/2-methylcitrate synthase [Candidatus Saccharimonadales bacterium]|nr:citrate/2-methylcitrate synthase [Candidatus Saccharimonadales bacterium]